MLNGNIEFRAFPCHLKKSGISRFWFLTYEIPCYSTISRPCMKPDIHAHTATHPWPNRAHLRNWSHRRMRCHGTCPNWWRHCTGHACWRPTPRSRPCGTQRPSHGHRYSLPLGSQPLGGNVRLEKGEKVVFSKAPMTDTLSLGEHYVRELSSHWQYGFLLSCNLYWSFKLILNKALLYSQMKQYMKQDNTMMVVLQLIL